MVVSAHVFVYVVDDVVGGVEVSFVIDENDLVRIFVVGPVFFFFFFFVLLCGVGVFIA